MNKAELITAAAEVAGITKNAMASALDAIQTVIKDQVASGNEVRLSGSFNLTVERKPARDGRNPSTGAKIKIPAKKAVKIKPAVELSRAANGE